MIKSPNLIGSAMNVENHVNGHTWRMPAHLGPLRMRQVGGRNLSSVHMGNLIPVTEMKNVQKAPKILVEPRSDLLATLQAMRSWKCFARTVPVSGWSVHMGKISRSVRSQDLGNRTSPPSHTNTCQISAILCADRGDRRKFHRRIEHT